MLFLFFYYLNILYEPERCEGLLLMPWTSEAGEEVLSINIHYVNILLSNLTLKDIQKKWTEAVNKVFLHCIHNMYKNKLLYMLFICVSKL